MTDETTHIATAAAALDDPYAALNQHLHGDGDAAWRTRALAAEAEVERLRAVLKRIETASRYWAEYEAAPDAVHYAHEGTARLARAALAEGGHDDR